MSTLQGLVGPLTSEFIPAGTCPGLEPRTVSLQANFHPQGASILPEDVRRGIPQHVRRPEATPSATRQRQQMPYRFECNTRPVGSDWGVFADCTTSTSTLEVGLDVIGAVPTSKLAGSSRDASGNPILTHAVINGYGIEVRWQQTDEALLFGATTASTASPTAWNSNPPAMTTQTESSSRPNAGAIAGIVVGSVIGALILLGIVVMIVRSKRKRRMKTANQGTFNHGGSHHEVYTGPRAELSGPGPMGIFPKYELPIPTPTGVIPRQELPVGQTLLNTEHTAQSHLVHHHKDVRGGVERERPEVVPVELEASERRGELEAEMRITELGDAERRF
ncbi:hypothetical protein EKO27_g6724 [Xylaria grammica]|uniref:Mid2 domain-containing protein n=1 Tax=Xylaria grammica TaxID=363999 RepID=A0A439D1Q9_9PEZI|nr:hypothetical protein EKO27_g6724 [Xylaria grammica]